MRNMRDAQNNVIVRESFSMAYMGGEIWFCQLDALYDKKELVMEKFHRDLEAIKRPSATGLVGINMNQTEIDRDMAVEITRCFKDLKKLRKVVFIGINRKIKNVIKTELQLNEQETGFVYTFIDDYEKAKLWLVGK